MPGRVGTFVVLAITGAALAFGPSSALGATTVGEDFAPTQPCFTFNSYVQSGSAGNQYAVPTDGVITSWSHQAGSIGPSLKFKVLRPKGSNTFSLVGESGLTPTVANQLNTFDTRIPVISGDLIGMFIGPGPGPNCALLTPGDPSFEVSFLIGDADVSDTVFTPQPEGKISLSAQLEPDADDDGFGDETQDLCPSDGTTQGACPKPARIGKVKVTGPAKAKRGGKATYKVKISNTGDFAASGVKVKVSGKGLSGSGSRGSIAAGKSATVTLKVKPRKPGKIKASFRVTSKNAGGKNVKKTITVKK